MPEISDFQYRRLTGVVEMLNERQKRLEPIREDLSKHYAIQEIHEIGPEVCIVEAESRGAKDAYFVPYINFKRVNEWATTFDQALLIALAAKYGNGGTTAAIYAARVLGMEETK